MDVLKFDIMEGERFVCTMKMPYNPVYKLTEKEIHDYIVSQRPSLERRNYKIEF